MKEQRKFARIRFGFQGEDINGHGGLMIEDISEGGGFVEAVGEVKHVNEGGLGVEFLEIDAASRRETGGFVRDFMLYQEDDYGKT